MKLRIYEGCLNGDKNPRTTLVDQIRSEMNGDALQMRVYISMQVMTNAAVLHEQAPESSGKQCTWMKERGRENTTDLR